jgi:UDP-N-acetylmuramate dehydrogenase
MADLLQKLPKVRGSYRPNAELKNWFNVGGAAEVVFRPADLADLQSFLKNLPKEIPLTVIGAGSNVIVADEGVKGVVIRLPGEFARISCIDDTIIAGCAALCGNVALHSKDAALTGFEFFTGIPGSVGGAVAMNAGCYGSDVSQILLSVTAIDFAGNLYELQASEFKFFYRGSELMRSAEKNFSGGLIFVEAKFKGKNSTREEIAKKIADLNEQRESSQPIRAKTGGSTFKNPKNSIKKAWQLIDEAGFRGMKKGDAQISEKHCNFMINTGKASARDLIDLGNEVVSAVKNKSGIELEWEIKILK